MTIPIPNLDTRTYDDLVNEVKALIPQYTTEWTNFNPSDPGIAFVELFAWVTESTLYRLNKIPDESLWNIIKLVLADKNELDLLQQEPLIKARARIQSWYNEKYRAVTEEDFISLVLGNKYGDDVYTPVRVNIIPSYDTGFITVVVVLKEYPFLEFGGDIDKLSTYSKTKTRIKGFLDERRLVGTRIKIRGAVFTNVSLDIRVSMVPGFEYQYQSNVNAITLLIEQKVIEYLDPLVGGDDGNGWGFGRPLSVHDVRALIETIDNVNRVTRLVINSVQTLKELSIDDLPRLVDLNVIVSSN